MAEHDYRPRNSAMMESQAVSGPTAGAEDGAPGPAPDGRVAVTPPPPAVPAGGGRPVPKPRTRQPVVQPQEPALPPYVIQPGSQQPPPYAAPGEEPAAGNKAAPAAVQEKTNRQFRAQLSPGHSFCTFWRGILEIVARVTVIVAGFFTLALSPAIINTIDSNDYFKILLAVDTSLLATDTLMISDTQDLIRNSKAVAEFMIFVGVMCFLVQIPSIVSRFILRCTPITLLVLHIVDAVVSGVLAVFFLGGGGAAASYSSQWSGPPEICEEAIIQFLKETLEDAGTTVSGITFTCDEEILTGQLAGLAVWGFVGLGVAGFLTFWAIYALKVKWDSGSNGFQEKGDEEANANGRAVAEN